MQCNKDNKQRVIHREASIGGKRYNMRSKYESPNTRHPTTPPKMKRRVENARRIDMKRGHHITDTPPKRVR